MFFRICREKKDEEEGSCLRRPFCSPIPCYRLVRWATRKAERHLPQDTVRRLLSRGFGDWKGQQSGEPARDSSDEDESTSSDEVRALYKGMIH